MEDGRTRQILLESLSVMMLSVTLEGGALILDEAVRDLVACTHSIVTYAQDQLANTR